MTEPVYLGCKIQPSVKRDFRIAAAKLGINTSDALRRAIENWLALVERDDPQIEINDTTNDKI